MNYKITYGLNISLENTEVSIMIYQKKKHLIRDGSQKLCWKITISFVLMKKSVFFLYIEAPYSQLLRLSELKKTNECMDPWNTVIQMGKGLLKLLQTMDYNTYIPLWAITIYLQPFLRIRNNVKLYWNRNRDQFKIPSVLFQLPFIETRVGLSDLILEL